MTIIYKDESYRVMGTCFEIYKEIGCGFVAPVYQKCLGLKFGLQEIPFRSQKKLLLRYKEHPLELTCKPDFICYKKIIVEVKAVSQLADKHRAQVFNYLKATGYKLGLLVNFGSHPQVEWERIAL